MEDIIQFTFKGKEYTGSILSSLDMTPHYHWVLFKHPEMRDILGEEIAFIVREAELRPVNPFLANKNKELFAEIKEAVEKHLQKV